MRRRSTRACLRGWSVARVRPGRRRRYVHSPPPRLDDELMHAVNAAASPKEPLPAVACPDPRDGLFGNPRLREPQDLMRLAEASVRHCEHLRARVTSVLHRERRPLLPTRRRLLHMLDRMSAAFCGAADTTSLCRGVHMDAAWRSAAAHANDVLTQYVHVLNSDANMWAAVEPLVSRREWHEALTSEERIAATQFVHECEMGGVNAPDPDAVVAALERVYDAMRAFEDSMVQPMDEQAKSLAVASASANTEAERRAAWRASQAQPRPWLQHLTKLTQEREGLAHALAQPSFGHTKLISNLLKKPEDVMHFLTSVNNSLRETYDGEVAALNRSKVQREGSPLQAWDVAYYKDQVGRSAEAVGLTSETGTSCHSLNEYFSIGNCVAGIDMVWNALFGLKLRVAPTTGDAELWAPGTIKLHVLEPKSGSDGDGNVIAVVYLDLWARPHKLGGAATHSLSFATVARDHTTSSFSSSSTTTTTTWNKARCAVVADFHPPSPNASAPPLLSLDDVVTLWHESGHVLSAVLGRSRLQQVAGLRSPLDWVEFPSTLMEHWCYEPTVVKHWALHHRHRTPVPEAELRAQLARVRSPWVGLSLHEQLVFAMSDTLMHRRSCAHPDSPLDVDAVVAEALGVLGAVGPVSGQAHQVLHSSRHLTDYAATCYAYLYCRSLSALVWRECFARDPWSRDAGAHFRRTVMQHGGGRDPTAMTREVLQRAHVNMEDAGRALLTQLKEYSPLYADDGSLKVS